MKALIIIAIIIFFIVLILLSKIRLNFKSFDSLKVKVGIYPIFFQVYPGKKRKNKIKLSDFSHKKYMKLIKNTPVEKKDNKDDNKPKSSNELLEITELLKFLFSRLNDYAQKVETRIKVLRITVGGEDADDTAKKYGLYSQGLSYLIEFLDNKTRLIPFRKENIIIKANFLSSTSSVEADFSLSVRLIYALGILFNFLSHKLSE